MKKILLTTLILGIITSSLFSQSEYDTLMTKVQLGDILIEGSNLDNTVHSNTINDKIQNLNQVKNVADLFKEIKGFSLIKRSAYALDPVFRSFKYDQLNIQYDGGAKAMHACPNRMDPTTTFVIPEEIEKIEIIRGPFSVRYGVNFGGIINMVTHRAPKLNEYGFHGNILAGFETNGSSLTTNALLGFANSKYDILFNGSIRDYGNYKNGNGDEVASSFKSYDYSIKTGYNVSTKQRLQLNLRQSFGRDVLHAGLPMDTDYDNSTIGSIDYKITNINSKLYAVQAKAYYSYVDHLMTNNGRKNFHIVEASTPVTATTMGGKLEFELTPTDNHILYLGADLVNLSREGNRTRIVKKNPMNPTIEFDIPKVFQDSIWQDASINTIGLFGEGKYHVNNKMSFGYGLRLDYVNTKSDYPVLEFQKLYTDFKNVNEYNIGGHLSLNYMLHKNLNLQFALGRGVRSGSMEEKYINHLTINKDPYEYVGNPLIKPEANHQIELNIKGRWDKLDFGTNLYYSYITNYITASVDSTIKRKYLAFKDPKVAKRFENIDVATQAGIEAYLEYEMINNLSLKFDIAYIHGVNVDWDEPLAQVMPLTTGLTLKYQSEKFWTDIRTQFVSEQDRISLRFGEKTTPAYTIMDFRIGYKPVNNITIAASILNIFDEYYYNHLNFSFANSTTNEGKIYEIGRNLNFFIRYDF